MRLIKFESDVIVRGSVIRFPAKWPYEDIVDFMVFDPLECDTGMGLIVSSGYKGGLISVILPKESEIRRSISAKWLKENWKKWVYPECSVDDVYVCEGYPVPDTLP
ncbi:Imm45 family immunity protein [Sphingomonas cavernae]|uniref:Immunity protein 45 domain-containing protein n=1 Tax=Sphingomonas cavernae TaxID=2320861 RepID=A0A418WPM7_9SPHN|nr:hypothetical protein D3876_02230 [Sphingomonas cavernae]